MKVWVIIIYLELVFSPKVRVINPLLMEETDREREFASLFQREALRKCNNLSSHMSVAELCRTLQKGIKPPSIRKCICDCYLCAIL